MSAAGPPPEAALFLIEETAEERRRRVEEIRRKIAAGSYEIASEEVADAVVAYFSRDLQPQAAPNPGASDDTC